MVPMKTHRTETSWAVLGAVVLAAVAFVAPAPAQQVGAEPGTATLSGQEVLAVYNAPEMRQDLDAILEQYGHIASANGLTEVAASVAEARVIVATMSDEELVTYSPLGGKLAELRVSAEDLALLLSSVAPPPAGGPDTPGLPDAPYSGLCGATRTDTNVLAAARLALNVAEGVWHVVNRNCEQVDVSGGNGGNASTSCIPADVVFVAARTVVEALEFCNEDVDEAEILGSYLRLGHIHGDLEQYFGDLAGLLNVMNVKLDDILSAIATAQAAIINEVNANEIKLDTLTGQLATCCTDLNTLINSAWNDIVAHINTAEANIASAINTCCSNLDLLINQVHSDLSQQLTQAESNIVTEVQGLEAGILQAINDCCTQLADLIQTQNQDWQDWKAWDLRMRIQDNLRRWQTYKNPIADFELPAAHGGHLELVREIVVDTMNRMVAANEAIYQAQLNLNAGDTQYTQGNWKRAYYYYSNAYHEAVATPDP